MQQRALSGLQVHHGCRRCPGLVNIVPSISLNQRIAAYTSQLTALAALSGPSLGKSSSQMARKDCAPSCLICESQWRRVTERRWSIIDGRYSTCLIVNEHGTIPGVCAWTYSATSGAAIRKAFRRIPTE